MARPGPAGLSSAEKADMWRRWKAGYRMREIARALRCDHGSIRNLLAQRGGISPRIRRRGRQALTLAEREDISRGIAADESARSIAARIGRAPSTVSREINRHGGRSSYRATDADQVAWESALRPKPCALALNGKLRNIVASKLSLDWSPEQVAGWLKLRYPDDERMRVSHETIYRSLFIQARGVLKKELIAHLRTRRTLRHSRRAGAGDELRGKIPDAVSIRDRPAEIEDRAIPGHWEGDMISGKKNSHIVTLVERQSRYTALVRVKNKETATVVAALTRQIRRLPTSLRRSLTWDRGHELSKHKAFTVATNVKRSLEPAAAWVEREHEWVVAPILSERNGPIRLQSVRSRSRRAASESPTA